MFRRVRRSSASPSSTLVRRRPGLDFSVTGIVYVGMMLFMGLAAMNSQANLLFGVFGLMIGILLVSGVISRMVLKRLELRRNLPDNGAVGQTLTLYYQITNNKRFWPSLSISVAELDAADAFTTQPQAYMLHAAPGMSASVPALVIPKRRGLHQFDRYQIATSFPFGFVKRALTRRHKDVILIHPAVAKVDSKLLAMCRSADLSGETVRPSPGGSDEFYGVKEYRAGDNPRWIYWRRSARSGTLITKEMTKVSPPRILLLVDTYIDADTAEQRALVERSIAMAASLAIVAIEQGLSVGLCAWSARWVQLNPTRGKRHRDDLLSVLSRLAFNAEHNLDVLLERSKLVLQAGTTPILFTPREVKMKALERSRNAMIVIPAQSPRALAWFKFDRQIDFANCTPMDQAAGGKRRGDTGTRRHEEGKSGRGDAVTQ
jgi:uncharacterized protein (DUF58 family)